MNDSNINFRELLVDILLAATDKTFEHSETKIDSLSENCLKALDSEAPYGLLGEKIAGFGRFNRLCMNLWLQHTMTTMGITTANISFTKRNGAKRTNGI